MSAAWQGFERVVTPEAVPIELDVAGLGSRGIAIMIDTLVQTACLIGLAFVIAVLDLGDVAAIVFISVGSFMLFFGYFFVFEGLWHGRTPGKRAQRLRVVRRDGHPMSATQMFVRNLIRVVDFLPAYYAIGCICLVLTKRSQRIGDLAAGTIVIREAKPFAPQPMLIPPPPPASVTGPSLPVDVSAMTDAHYQLLRGFFERRGGLEPTARAHLAGQIASAIRPVVRTSVAIPDERLLEMAAMAYRKRFAQS